jgi:hypothetical protein
MIPKITAIISISIAPIIYPSTPFIQRRFFTICCLTKK